MSNFEPDVFVAGRNAEREWEAMQKPKMQPKYAKMLAEYEAVAEKHGNPSRWWGGIIPVIITIIIAVVICAMYANAMML